MIKVTGALVRVAEVLRSLGLREESDNLHSADFYSAFYVGVSGFWKHSNILS
jgi:hypothetical protein